MQRRLGRFTFSSPLFSTMGSLHGPCLPWQEGTVRDNAERMPLPAQVDARKFERKRAPMSAKLTDLKGQLVIECTVRDVSTVGAQVALPSGQPIPDKVFLIDLTNRVAY